MYFSGSGLSLSFSSLQLNPHSGNKFYSFLFYKKHEICDLFISFLNDFRVFAIVFAGLREKILHMHSRSTHPSVIREVCRPINQGDWFLLSQLGKNMDPLIFKEFLETLAASFTSGSDRNG